MSVPLVEKTRLSGVLFNDPRFHALHAPAGARSLVLEHEEDGRPVGALAGVLDGDVFTSGFSAPFGGVDLVKADETPGRIVALVRAAVARLDELGVQTARVRCRPACHGAGEDAVRFALLNAGFVVEEADLAFVLDLRATPDAAAWLAARKAPLRRALRHADPERHELRDADDWERAFALLEANRAVKGRRLSIGLDQVLAVREAFGERIRLAELRRDGAPVAAALTYRASERAELVVAWGDAGHDLERSPMPVLALRLVERAIDEGLHALDLGTSTLVAADGSREPNDGLVQFKRVCGAAAELRPVLVRTR
ncbi:MAG TPA: GNAT family N-acetyltransferase [Baekduia sp.]|nr:GNAT family N-acetyltransferase [Baekduia sp.]